MWALMAPASAAPAAGAAAWPHLKFQSTVKEPQEATIQRSCRPASVIHVNLPFCSCARPTCARVQTFQRGSSKSDTSCKLGLLQLRTPRLRRTLYLCRIRIQGLVG